ncbi:MAG: rSAM-modified peptide [Bacteroides sp.]|nr:rSAM-modified peptide [Bacteroides sp.]
MKSLNKIKLSSFAGKELQSRELGKILGGENCCICSCSPDKLWDNVRGTGQDSYNNNDENGAGYGSGELGAPKTR